MKTACALGKSFLFFCCTTVALLQFCRALLQKRKRWIWLTRWLLPCCCRSCRKIQYTYLFVQHHLLGLCKSGGYLSLLLSSAEASRVSGCPPNAKKRAVARTHFYINHGGIYLANRKRNQTLSIRLTPTEKKEIIIKAKQAQMTLTDYLIECSRNTNITVTDLTEVLVELKRIGNNLNQIARKANSRRFFFPKFDSVIEGQRKIFDAIWSLTGGD